MHNAIMHLTFVHYGATGTAQPASVCALPPAPGGGSPAAFRPAERDNPTREYQRAFDYKPLNERMEEALPLMSA